MQWRFSPVVFLGLILAACAAPPTQEMMEAREGIRVAEAAGAGHYAPEQLARARGAVADAERGLDLGDYSTARDAARKAVADAGMAQGLAMLIGESVVAVERVRGRGIAVPLADEAIVAAINAGRAGQRSHAEAYAFRAIELARGEENAHLLQAARDLRARCAPRAGAEPRLDEVSRAMDRKEGQTALDLAREVCGEPPSPKRP